MPLPPLNFPNLPGRPVPGDDVHFKITVNTTPCAPPQEIADYDGQWLKIPLRELVVSGAIHYQNTNLPIIPGERALEGRMRTSWEDIWKANPRTVSVDGRNRLIVGPIGDPDEQTRLSYILGDTIGVAVAKRVFRVSYAAVRKRNYAPDVRHDFELATGNNRVKLETRGRYNRGHRTEALRQIGVKFGAVRDFNRAMGVLVFPSDDPNRAFEDVEIVDPEGEDAPPTRPYMARQVLSHYLPYFDEQNVTMRFVIRGLLNMEDAELEAVLANGVPDILQSRNYRRIAHFGRISLPLGDDRFFGTAYEGWAPPRWGGPEIPGAREGQFFWGVSRSVLRRLGTFQLLDLFRTGSGFQATTTDAGVQLFLFDDGILVAWTPNWETLQQTVRES